MIKKLLLISSLIIPLSIIASENKVKEWEASGRINMYIQNINIVGGGSTSPEGETHNAELNLNVNGPLGNGEAGVESRVRGTNDRRIQKDGGELLYLRSYYRDKIWGIEAGDVALSINPYVYSGSVKGAKATYKSPDKKNALNYSIISGIKKSSWRELYTQEENEAPTAYSGAFEAKYIYERAKEIAISAAGYQDDLATEGSASSTAGKKGYVIGLNGKWRFNKYITLKGRTAFSDGKDNIRDNNTTSRSKGAVYLKLLTRPFIKSVKSNFIYQRIDSGFISFGGNANEDKEQIENSTTWRINKEFRARMDLKANRDNLDGKLGDTKNLHYEALSLTYRPAFVKRTDITLRGSNKGYDGRGSDSVTQTAGVDFNMRKKSGWRYGLGYDYRNVDDKNSTTSSSITNTFKATLGYKEKLSKTSSYRFTIKPSYLVINKTENKIGLKVDAGYIYNRASVDILYLLHQTDYEDENTNDTTNTTYQLRAAYKLKDKGSDAIRVLLEKRDVDVDNNSNSTYSEYKGKVTLVMNF